MISMGERKKRKRISVKRDELLDPNEERMLKIAIANSKSEVQRKRLHPPSAAIFRPTLEEFRDPLLYMASIRSIAEKDGICKIIPPKGWNPSFKCDLNPTATFATKLQQVHALQEGKYYGEGKRYTLESYQEMADAFKEKWLKEKGIDAANFTSDQCETAYWDIVQMGLEKLEVEYANDLDTTVHGSGFPALASNRKLFMKFLDASNDIPDFNDEEYYKRCGWNLNNLPQWPGSVLRHIRTPINGVNIPWLYLGMLFTTFCWHTEDNFLYSINYMHKGATKSWYGVPSCDARQFEKVMRNKVPLRFRENPDLLFHLVTMLSPTTLLSEKVRVTKLDQNPGEFVVTFPNAYHAGFNQGFNCAEAVNFAMPDWIQYGRECSEKYRTFARSSVFSYDRLVCTLSRCIREHNQESCKLLIKELKDLLNEEVYMRQLLHNAGVVKVVEMPGSKNIATIDESTMKDDDKRQCLICKHTCFISGIICKCNPNVVSCLRHFKEMCKCAPQTKCFLFWLGIKDLEQMIHRISTHLQELKTAESIQQKQQDENSVVLKQPFVKTPELVKVVNEEYVL